MSDNPDSTTNRHGIWVRGFYMLLMIFIFQISGTVMFVVMIIQFVIMLLNHTPNARLVSFGGSLGRYMQQIVNFLTYAAEEIPFPFSDWPSGEPQ